MWALQWRACPQAPCSFNLTLTHLSATVSIGDSVESFVNFSVFLKVVQILEPIHNVHYRELFVSLSEFVFAFLFFFFLFVMKLHLLLFDGCMLNKSTKINKLDNCGCCFQPAC